jgi:F0F1-type ATP synthase gamma subunit
MRIKKVKNDLTTTLQFGQLAQALQEISVIKMADIRALVLKAREYEEGLTEIFADIRLSTKGTKEENETLKLQAKYNKRVVILLSANNKLFGHITDVVYAKCMSEVLDSEDDLIIVGKIGKQKYERDKHTKQYTYYELPDYDITFMDILPMLSHIVEYKSIRVYYALSTNIMSQEAVAKNITGEDIIVKREQQKEQKLYLVEPSAEALYSFFTGQIVGIFFKQTIYEYELARHSSRIKTLEESINHVDENKRKQGRVLSQLIKGEKERRQQMQNMYLYVRKRYG